MPTKSAAAHTLEAALAAGLLPAPAAPPPDPAPPPEGEAPEAAAPLPARSLAELRAPRPSRPLGKRTLARIGRAPAAAAPVECERFFGAHRLALARLMPRGMSVDRLLAVVLAAIADDPRLGECSVASLFGAASYCARLGLEPNTAAGHAFLLARRVSEPRKDPDGTVLTAAGGTWLWDEWTEAQAQIGYKGKMELAYRSPRIALLKSVLVYEHDPVFDLCEGTEQTIRHQPLIRGDRGAVLGAYAVAKLATGAWLSEWMTEADIVEVRDRYSEAYGVAASVLASETASERERERARNTAWIGSFEAMARKTVMHRLCGQIPQSPELALALDMDDRGVRGAQNTARLIDEAISAQSIEDAGRAQRQKPPAITQARLELDAA